jgi:hypothetical protein
MPRTIQHAAPVSGSRKKRRFKIPVSDGLIAAAVSIPQPLYLKALSHADDEHEGNFSRYVRTLIKRDLRSA